jgi:23S rRNA-/tRNA-specific pseudouridylate synthase
MIPDLPSSKSDSEGGPLTEEFRRRLAGGGDQVGRATPESAPKKKDTLLDWVVRRFPDSPKSRAKQWILAGRVSVGGVVKRKPHEAMSDPGEALALQGKHATTLDCGTGWQIHPRVSLLYLDSALAIVNKGPGLISVPATAGELSALNILADFLIGKLKARERGVAGRSLPPVYRRLTPLPVHRLDQYTSGVFCIAMNPAARGHLIEQLKAHSMQREYVAYVEGKPTTARGTWRNWLQLSKDELKQRVLSAAEAPSTREREFDQNNFHPPPNSGSFAPPAGRGLGRGGRHLDSEERENMPNAEGDGSAGASPYRKEDREGPEIREAITHFEVVGEFLLRGGKGIVSKLRLRLETGRKHQIRAQAAHASVPLIGDRTYNPQLRRPDPEKPTIDFPRQALHAEVLKLEHPEQGKRMEWKAELPKDLWELERELRAGRI